MFFVDCINAMILQLLTLVNTKLQQYCMWIYYSILVYAHGHQ